MYGVSKTFGRVLRGLGYRQRLGSENVQTGPGDPFFPQRFDQRIFVDHRPAGRVDQQGGRFYFGQPLPIRQTAQFIGKPQVNENDVGAGEQFVRGQPQQIRIVRVVTYTAIPAVTFIPNAAAIRPTGRLEGCTGRSKIVTSPRSRLRDTAGAAAS
jgi:hypothetical protein